MPGSKIRLLLIDDDPAGAARVRGLLDEIPSFDYELRTLSTREAAARVFESQDDCDLCLLRLPRDGAERIECVRQLAAQARPRPLLVLAESQDRALDLAVMDAGAADFLVLESLSGLLLERSIRYAVFQAGTARTLSGSEERFRLISENADDIIWMADLDLRLTYVSPAIQRILGYSPEEALQITVEELLAPDSYRRATELVRKELQREATGQADPNRRHVLEVQKYHRDGRLIWLEIRAGFLRDPEGRPTGILGVSRDISERKAAEEERRQLERQMQEAQRMESLGVLAGGVAHDFNNLLMGVLGNAELVLMQLPDDSPLRMQLSEITRSAHRAAELTNQMLAYAGHGKYVVEQISISRLIRTMSNLLSAAISKKAVLAFNLSEPLPPVEADASQLRQVVMNLVTNASEAIEETSGTITVSTGVMEADAAFLEGCVVTPAPRPGLYVYLEVTDTGCGMDASTVARVFDPFFSTRFLGRGLGLAAVLGILRGHNGTIKLHSRPGVGSTFQALLPAAIPEDLGPRAVQGSCGSVGTVLIADDEEAICSIARLALGRQGYQVITAATGRIAVQEFYRHAQDIIAVVLDMTMPELSGEEAYREIRKLDSRVPVLLSSGYPQEMAANRFHERGLAGFIQKPYRPQDLVARIREITGG